MAPKVLGMAPKVVGTAPKCWECPQKQWECPQSGGNVPWCPLSGHKTSLPSEVVSKGDLGWVMLVWGFQSYWFALGWAPQRVGGLRVPQLEWGLFVLANGWRALVALRHD